MRKLDEYKFTIEELQKEALLYCHYEGIDEFHVYSGRLNQIISCGDENSRWFCFVDEIEIELED